jgi:AraC-like DNA-binding protein
MIRLEESEGANRIILLLQVLEELSGTDDYKYLSSPDFKFNIHLTGDKRLNKVIKYISDNYQKELTLEEIANIAALTPNSFCRFFKKRTNKTLIQFINEIKVEKACQMLINKEDTIIQICYNSGFNSLVSFNRVFKSITKQAPSEYRKKYLPFKIQDSLMDTLAYK